jgi:F0F1-type ATP synthase assembly protein I
MILAAGAGAGASAGPLGLVVVLLIGVATALLIRNMNGRLKRLPPSFEKPDEPQDKDPDVGSEV